MGGVPAKVRYRSDRNRWEVVIHHDSRRTRKAFGKGLEAEHRAREFAALWNDQEAAAQRFGTAGGAQRLDQCMRDWLATYRATLSASTAQTNHGLIENHLVPHFGGADLRTLTEADAIKFVEASLERGMSIHVPERALALVTRVCNLLVQAGVLERNPIRGIGRVVGRIRNQRAESTETVNVWTLPELERILALAEKRERWLYPVLVFLSHTGARRGEALALRWEDVDFERGRIWIRRARVRGETKAPKSGKARRVPMDAAGPRLRSVLEELASSRIGREGIGSSPELVFLSPTGKPMLERNLSRAWERLRSHFGAAKIRPLRLHDFRHTFATQALEHGVSILTVAQWLGHSATRVTELYAHVISESETVGFLSRAPDGPKRPQNPATQNAGSAK